MEIVISVDTEQIEKEIEEQVEEFRRMGLLPIADEVIKEIEHD